MGLHPFLRHQCAFYVTILASDELTRLGVDGVGDRRSWAILAGSFSMENWERQEERNRSKKVGREMLSKQPSSTAEIR